MLGSTAKLSPWTFGFAYKPMPGDRIELPYYGKVLQLELWLNCKVMKSVLGSTAKISPWTFGFGYKSMTGDRIALPYYAR